MPSGFNSRSLQGVKQVTPAYSKYYKLAKEAHEAGSHTAGNELFRKGAAIELSTGRTITPLERRTAEAGERFLAAGQGMQMQQAQQMQGGGWQNPAGWQNPVAPAVVADPMKGRFFGHLQQLPQGQQAAMLNRFGRQLQEQSILNAKENKAWLDVQEAHRKVQRDQQADAGTLQFQLKLMGSFNDPNKSTEQKEKDMINTALGNPAVFRHIENREVFSELSKGITRQLTEEGKEISHIRAAKLSAINSLMSKNSDLGVRFLQRMALNQDNPKAAKNIKARWDELAELGAFMQAAESSKGREDLFEETLKLAQANPKTFDVIAPDLAKLATTDAQKLRLSTASVIAEKIVGEEEIEAELANLEKYLEFANATLASFGYKEQAGGKAFDPRRSLEDLTETLVRFTVELPEIKKRAGHIRVGNKKPYTPVSEIQDRQEFVNSVATVNQFRNVIEALIESYRGEKSKRRAQDESSKQTRSMFQRNK